MNKANEKFLSDLKDLIAEIVDTKYRLGYKKHADKEGDIWDNPLLLDNAIDEAIDLVIYLLTLKYQNEKKN